jgi:hypothetical protein
MQKSPSLDNILRTYNKHQASLVKITIQCATYCCYNSIYIPEHEVRGL